jgi:DNA-binding CsgD family transcriptional regulator
MVAHISRATDANTSKATSFHFPGREPLTRREQDVLGHIVAGASSKEAGRRLAISPRTIEVHRARIMEKLGAKNAADLVRIVYDEGRRSGIRDQQSGLGNQRSGIGEESGIDD